MSAALKALEAFMEAETAKLQDKVAQRATMAVAAQLGDWKRRFPRHTFTAWEGHGLLAFDIDPPLLGDRSLQYRGTGYRGAIADLFKEAEDFIDAWNGLEHRLTTMLEEELSI